MARAVPGGSLPATMGTGRVLVVDDDAMNRKLFGAVLAKAGFQVTLACDGAEALALTAVEAPDLVLLDYMMPDMNGPEVLVRLRARPHMKGVPVFLVTASTLPEHIEDGRRAGADDYLFKPIDPRVLRTRVAAALCEIEARRCAASGAMPEAVSQ